MVHSKFSLSQVIATGLIVLGMAACNNKPSHGNNSTDKPDQTTNNSTILNKQDSIFILKANAINLEEIKLGNLAVDKTKSDAVKELANMLVTDHNQLKQNLNEVATLKSMSLTSGLSSDAQTAYNKLDTLSEADFDRKYADMMVNGHKGAIDIFEEDSAKTKDPDVKKYAVNTLPILRKHLAEAEKCKDAVENSK